MPLKDRTEKSDSESLKFRHATLPESLAFSPGGKRGLRLKPFELKSETVFE
jgi:hypothetical protein